MPPVVYAVGDVHGCLDLLKRLEEDIAKDARQFGGTGIVVFLGDLIDRGPLSANVIDHMLTSDLGDLQRICLCGNHEDMFLRFLEQPSLDHPWLEFGGRETLHSYGMSLDDLVDRRHLQYRLDAMVPTDHVSFLKALPISLELPDYLLVHAGIDPERRLSDQREADLLSIRGRFVHAEGPFEKCIVHGHTPFADVEVTPHRISVDTGAYATGALSCVRLTDADEPKVLVANHMPRLG